MSTTPTRKSPTTLPPAPKKAKKALCQTLSLVSAAKILSHKDALAIADEIIATQLPMLDTETTWGDDKSEPTEPTEPTEPVTLLQEWLRKLQGATRSFHPYIFIRFLGTIVDQKLQLPKTVGHIVSELNEVSRYLLDDLDEFKNDDSPMAGNIWKCISRHKTSLLAICPELHRHAEDILQFEFNEETQYYGRIGSD
tara:strand:+ start:175 stop:762 length:588 start_codon:yes stop_codon:yes gene_type:complete